MVARMSGSGSPDRISPFSTSSGGNVRHGQDAGANAVPPGGDPEGGSAADGGDLGHLDRHEVEEELGHRLLDDAEIRQVGPHVAHEEVEDIVLAGVGAGGRGRLRRVAGLEAVVAALRRQARHVRQPALCHPLLGQRRLHAVEPEDDHLLGVPLRGTALLARSDAHAQQAGGDGDGAARSHGCPLPGTADPGLGSSIARVR